MEELIAKLKSYITDAADLKLIKDAHDFALEKHKGQLRASGEPYIIHPIAVASILADLQVSPETIAAGFLHDVVEDCNVKIEEINERFGEEVAYLVESLTKFRRIKSMSLEDLDNENYRKLFVAMAKDVRVIIIKLADRLHNMRTLQYLPVEKQKHIAQATLDVYAPIAHRLGLFNIKSELENLALKYLDPEQYDYVEKKLNATKEEREASVQAMIEALHKLLRENHMDFRIYGRAKSIYSIYKKLQKGRTFDDIYDLLALRIITNNELQCYEVLGYIHAVYKPIPGRFKDYIAMPKPNMYQALHTSIVGEGGYIYEIQIKTEHMEEVAESGVAAHWKYKEGIKESNKALQNEIEEKLHWFRDFVSMSENEEEDAKEYVESLKKDIFEANIYVLTPRGLVINLPGGSTPIDFAYKVHSKVGDSAVGAVVNGHLVPLNSELHTGDLVEIKTSKLHSYPSEGWLEFVKTSQAKSKIRKALQKKNLVENKDESIAHGKEMLMDELRERNINEKDATKIMDDNNMLEALGYKTYPDLYYAIYMKTVNPITVATRIKQKKDGEGTQEVSSFKRKSNVGKNRYGISIQGADDLLVTLSQCCSPIPGDEIVGYISKGKGIKIHRKDCATIANEKRRLIEATWTEEAFTSEMHPADLIIQANDRPNLLVDIMNILTQNKINVMEITATSHKQELTASLYATVLVRDASHLQTVINILSNVTNVYEVKRSQRN